MTSTRADPFADAGDLDLSDFSPRAKPKPDAKKVRAVSEANQFPSRTAGKPEPPPSPAVGASLMRRRRTGRSVQFNIKATQDVIDRFVRISDEEGWVFGETLERAIEALERARKK